MSGLITQVYRTTVQERKFLRKVAQDIRRGENIPPSMLDKYYSMNKVYPRSKNPIVNIVNWVRTFNENLYQMTIGNINKR